MVYLPDPYFSNMSQTKECRGTHGCGKFLPKTNFGNHPNSADGLQGTCKECQKAYMKKKRQNAAYRKKERAQQQTESAKKKKRKNFKKRRNTDRGNLIDSLRRNLSHFYDKNDSERNRRLFGCTRAEFRAHIKSQFAPWMNENNRGKETGGKFNVCWSFDHIVPFDKFKTYEDLEDYKHVVCWYKNVRPLCTKKNRLESNICTLEMKNALIERYCRDYFE